jgi:hypothetical protein
MGNRRYRRRRNQNTPEQRRAEQTKNGAHQQQEEPYRGTFPTPIHPEPIYNQVNPNISNAECHNNVNNSTNNKIIARWTRVVGIFTTVLAIATAASVYVLYLTDENARKAQRAFVAIRGISVTPLGPPASQEIAYRIAMIWENSGTTETHDLEIGDGWLINPLPRWPFTTSGRKRVLLPKAILEEGDLTVGGPELNAIHDGRTIISLFGFAKYRDTFGSKHITLACLKLGTANVDYTKEGAKGVSAYQCGEYNCTDYDCKRYKSMPELKSILDYLD